MKFRRDWKRLTSRFPAIGKLCAMAVLVAAGETHAATYYVAPSGNDANAGTSWAAPKQTIQAAIDLTVSNDVVLVSKDLPMR